MKHFLALIFTLSIPCFLLAAIRQSWKYDAVIREITIYDEEQHALIAENKRKISGISILSKPQRIEKIANEELQMTKAKSSDIIRITLQNTKG